LAAKCSHEDSRLTCIDCSSPICSQCLVECPVGFRCKSCVGGQVKSPLTAAAPMLKVRTSALCAGIGCGAGWVMSFINIPYIGCFICYFLGLFAGRWLAKIIDYRTMGGSVTKTIVVGLLIGMCLSPFGFLPFLIVEILKQAITGQGTQVFNAITAIVSGLFSPALFIVGVLKPTVWGER